MQKRIVIIGGGFAGINLALELGKNTYYQVTLVDKNNYNFFPPLIYQVATAYLEPSSISYPIRKLFRSKDNLHFRLGELVKVVPESKQVVLSNGDLDYDMLVFATGAETNYFGMENVKKHAIPMKTLSDAIQMRNRLLTHFEEATISKDPDEVRKTLNIVIAGGGPTGVEISGMFAEMRYRIMHKDYPELKNTGAEIYLVDGGAALLKPMSKKSQQHTLEQLTALGVKVILNSHVSDFVDDEVIFSDGTKIPTKNLIWAAGVSAMQFEGIPITSYGRGKRLMVNAYHQIEGLTDIYAIGDTCYLTGDPAYPEGHPQVAQVAIQQGKNLAANFKRLAEKKDQRGFVYSDRGSMAIIGRNQAVVDLPKPKIHLKGFIAWCAWLFIHLLSLISYRNRINTFYHWTVAYFSRDQSLRMIIRPVDLPSTDAEPLEELNTSPQDLHKL
ncbi:NAD(P)/FAD-dependent oxidoreductase [Pedobacter sp. MC2016-15]|uniref:NAD(P)/FAD-dependent oxidoreductase n=1 Tax=Pedobacter sp. MC2016-15 TaxID=2994473 RepID=UPI0022456A0D|nr:NAD(P)/FAD-dependent oxidoreductase [Pedobacter sp. MC2016-15]MCX2477531.1 NAD(P)/FAD-dependent oxidoreductase [Pedobacter sp. MC2016-15]